MPRGSNKRGRIGNRVIRRGGWGIPGETSDSSITFPPDRNYKDKMGKDVIADNKKIGKN